MDREEAIEYLQRKNEIRQPTKKVVEWKPEKKVKIKMKKHVRWLNPKFNKEEEKEINKVMRRGKIYGDPIAEVQW